MAVVGVIQVQSTAQSDGLVWGSAAALSVEHSQKLLFQQHRKRCHEYY